MINLTIFILALQGALFFGNPVLAEGPPSPSPNPKLTPLVATPGELDKDDISESEEKQLSDETVLKPEIPKPGTFWVSPDFSKQDGAIGWAPHAFESPPGFRVRQKFWIDIYTKYTTHQAVIHDAHYLDITYKVIDFSDLDGNLKLSSGEREKAKKKRIKEEKKNIKEILQNVQRDEDSPSKMPIEELEIYNKFRYVFEKNKFKAASQRNRLRMQLGQKDRFILGIYYSGRYIREMENIFREEKVPIELTRLPFVESSFNLYAYSRVGASGIWQFMRSTGRLYLKTDKIVDLRNDPLRSTRAAAKLLRSNYKLLGSWPLALTAYNHGPSGVSHIVKNMKTVDLNEIVWNTTRRRFGFASENFYAEFLGALEVESHAAKYFGKIEVSPPLVYDELEIPQPLRFSKLSETIGPDTTLYNPFFTKAVLNGSTVIPKGFMIRVPKDQKEKVLVELTKLADSLKN